jgi:hypothetical protein
MNNEALQRLLKAIIIIVLVIIISRFLPKKSDPEEIRRRDLAALARKLQLQFNPNSDLKLAGRFSFRTWLRPGDAAYNVFHGYYMDSLVTIFDFTFMAGRYTYYWSAFVIEMRTNFQDLVISHEKLEYRFAEALGDSHIVFESNEFSRAFRVRCSDKKFAYDVCSPQMMEYLLANKDLTIEIRGAAIAILFEDWLRPEKVESNLSRLVEIRKLLPHYLFTKS